MTEPISTRQAAPSIFFLGVRVDNVTLEQAVARIERFMDEPGLHQVATVNPEFVMAAQRDAEFKRVLNGADLCVPDGVGLIWGSWILGSASGRLSGRVTGVDLVWRLAGLAAKRGSSIFLLGGRSGVGEQCAARLRSLYPTLNVAGTYEGSPDDPMSVERVLTVRPDILLVAYGHPAQDLWIHKQSVSLPACVAIGVGGAFDYISGRTLRAPGWLRRLGLEWLYRLVHQPWRWRRMIVLPQFGWRMLLERRRRSSAARSR